MPLIRMEQVRVGTHEKGSSGVVFDTNKLRTDVIERRLFVDLILRQLGKDVIAGLKVTVTFTVEG